MPVDGGSGGGWSDDPHNDDELHPALKFLVLLTLSMIVGMYAGGALVMLAYIASRLF